MKDKKESPQGRETAIAMAALIIELENLKQYADACHAKTRQWLTWA